MAARRGVPLESSALSRPTSLSTVAPPPRGLVHLDEAERRDPRHHRSWFALVDGNSHQFVGKVDSASLSDAKVIGGLPQDLLNWVDSRGGPTSEGYVEI
jgi:hypothetical protein